MSDYRLCSFPSWWTKTRRRRTLERFLKSPSACRSSLSVTLASKTAFRRVWTTSGMLWFTSSRFEKRCFFAPWLKLHSNTCCELMVNSTTIYFQAVFHTKKHSIIFLSWREHFFAGSFAFDSDWEIFVLLFPAIRLVSFPVIPGLKVSQIRWGANNRRYAGYWHRWSHFYKKRFWIMALSAIVRHWSCNEVSLS